MTVGSLFSGIGGFDLGFERAGYEITWQVEVDEYANRVLAKHWPHIVRYGDICAIDWATVTPVDVICGGFPCQPHSLTGRRGASTDKRDLWSEFVRAIRGIKPRWVVAENVPGLLSSESGRFFGRVLRDLAESGYIAQWDCLPASAFNAPHRRERVWIVAYTNCGQCSIERRTTGRCQSGAGCHVSNANLYDGEGVRTGRDAAKDRQESPSRSARLFYGTRPNRMWPPEPDVGRVGHGIPARVDRLRGLGNAIVPQIAEWIAGRILAAEGVDAAP